MRPPALSELDRLSADLGRDPEQVQAAGGNTSLKEDGLLWVKASGLWLADALASDIFVPVRLDAVLEGVAQDRADPVTDAIVAERNPQALRPSIETTLHALLPHRVVVHTHSVRTIALAIREDAEERLAKRLRGLAWAWVPYKKPGLPLTRLVTERMAGRKVDVLVLGNHGLVVGAESAAAAALLLREIERRLDAPARPLPQPVPGQVAAAAAELGLRPVRYACAHGLALDGAAARRAAAGSLYPDHVIFLGPAAIYPGGAGSAARGSALRLVPGVGAFLPPASTRSADELALCLALVLQRVPEDARLRYLAAPDEAALLDWDAEKYRQALADARPT